MSKLCISEDSQIILLSVVENSSKTECNLCQLTHSTAKLLSGRSPGRVCVYNRSYLEALSESPSHLLPRAVRHIFSQVCPSRCLIKVSRTERLNFEHSDVEIKLMDMQSEGGEVLEKR